MMSRGTSRSEELLVAFQGTWEYQDGGEDGNVAWIARRYQDGGGAVDLVPGIGTRLETVGRWMGGAFGIGMKDRAREAMSTVDVHGPSVVDVVAWSRGTGSAMLFAEMLRAGRPWVRIRLMVLFDSVIQRWLPWIGSDGMPDRVPENVDFCLHVLAAEERRRMFPLRRWRGESAAVWVGGNHERAGRGFVARLLAAEQCSRFGLPGFDGSFPEQPSSIAPADWMSVSRRRVRHVRAGDGFVQRIETQPARSSR